ncbi:MAG: isopentenyl-diphosphate delta-isomerase idi1 [Phylliscum demangeonii]|nr:MAG: isopentenyl-diphosphate delta-isomerase idi1 [Phylliscum demangeonii]
MTAAAARTTTVQSTPVLTSVLHLVPDVDASHVYGNASADDELSGYDEEQVRLMEEVCIAVDADDTPIGSADKKTCHLMTNIDQGLLHRAFSVFLFDSQNRLLLQQRATEKITFPDMWTNTCCSHPLGIPGETGSDFDTAIQGVRRAARRKLHHELGIRPEDVRLDELRFLTRIHYKAASSGKWGEHEIDYILFMKSDVTLAVNPNEVRDTRYVSAEELKAMFARADLPFTPWFQLICNTMLFEWWDHLKRGSLAELKPEMQIRRML